MSEYFYVAAWWQQGIPTRPVHIWSKICDVKPFLKLRAHFMQQDKSLNMTPVRNRHLQAIERIMFLPGWLDRSLPVPLSFQFLGAEQLVLDIKMFMVYHFISRWWHFHWQQSRPFRQNSVKNNPCSSFKRQAQTLLKGRTKMFIRLQVLIL